MPRQITKPTQLQQRLAECERGARLIKGLFDAGDAVPDWLTDAVMDALDTAAGFKGIPHFGETDFDLDGVVVSRHASLRPAPQS